MTIHLSSFFYYEKDAPSGASDWFYSFSTTEILPSAKALG